MKVSEFLAKVYRCRTCRHYIGFSETCVEGVRVDECEGGCPADGEPCDKWEPAEAGPYSDVSPVFASYAQRLAREAKAFDKDNRTEDWLMHRCYTDGRVAQAIDAENARAAKGGEE